MSTSVSAGQKRVLLAARDGHLFWNPQSGDYSVGEQLTSWITPTGLSWYIRNGFLTSGLAITQAGRDALAGAGA